MRLIQELKRFTAYTRLGYLLFTSVLLLGAVFGLYELIRLVIFTNLSQNALRWLFVSRGVIASLVLMVWAAWTIYSYRELYEEQLELAESRYRDIIENTADAILTLNLDNRITSWNQAAEDIFGWKREEIIGQPITVIIPEELIEKQELECIEFGLRYRGYVRNYETERLNKNGNRILVHLTESYIRDEDGEIIGRSQIMRDLTELKVREQQVQHSERLATVGHMAAGVAHEVGNPLTAISSLAQVCQRKTDDPFIQDQLSKIRTHIQRINKIVRDLVDFSRPSSHDAKPTAVNEIIQSAVGLLEHDARCREVAFNMILDQQLPMIHCVPDHLHQVLVNLLLNAVDALKNTENPRIEIRTKQKDEGIEVQVSDVGKGIDPEYQERIFEPFFTTKEVGSGTGLGLSVSHGIISRLGGSIDVKSEKGEGTTFIITLPVARTNNNDSG